MTVVLRQAALATTFVLSSYAIVGCQAAVITSPGFDLPEDNETPPEFTPEDVDPEVFFVEAVEPLLQERCGNCHANEAQATTPQFLVSGDYYGTLHDYVNDDGAPMFTPGAPTDSLLITKGRHAGPPWNDAQAQTVGQWIMAEAGDLSGEDPNNGGPVVVEDDVPDDIDPIGEEWPVAGPIRAAEGPNRIGLANVGLPGAALVFEAEVRGVGVQLSGIGIQAGPDEDIHVEWLAILQYDEESSPSVVESTRFRNLSLDIPAGGTYVIPDSTLTLIADEDGTVRIGGTFRISHEVPDV